MSNTLSNQQSLQTICINAIKKQLSHSFTILDQGLCKSIVEILCQLIQETHLITNYDEGIDYTIFMENNHKIVLRLSPLFYVSPTLNSKIKIVFLIFCKVRRYRRIQQLGCFKTNLQHTVCFPSGIYKIIYQCHAILCF